MSKSSERRLAENEVMFRQANQKVQNDLLDVEKNAQAEGYKSLTLNKDLPLHFFCECSDANCHERIEVTSDRYESLHRNSSQFLLKPGHENSSIERIVLEEPGYIVVEKFMTPPKKARKLN